MGCLLLLILLVIVFAAAATLLPAQFQGIAGLLLAIAALVTILSLIAIVAGIGLLRLRKWAWWLTVILGVLQVVFQFGQYAVYPPGGFPYGAAIWIIIIIYLVIVRSHFGIGRPTMAAPM